MPNAPICQQCKLRPPSRKGRPYCSKACSNSARLVPLSERFVRYYQPGDPAECWPWLGTTDRDGYGVIGDERRRQLRAHRVSYERFHGVVVPAGNYVLHSCDNPVCVNPHHLRVGSLADNSADKVARGRQPRGAASGVAKLTEDDVREIRRLAEGHVSNGRWSTGTTFRAIARRFGVTPTNVGDIVKGKIWKHVL
jgi:hypothetical protein